MTAEELNKAVNELNDYPHNQNERTVYVLEEDGRITYYTSWYDRYFRSELLAGYTKFVKDKNELQALMQVSDRRHDFYNTYKNLVK